MTKKQEDLLGKLFEREFLKHEHSGDIERSRTPSYEKEEEKKKGRMSHGMRNNPNLGLPFPENQKMRTARITSGRRISKL